MRLFHPTDMFGDKVCVIVMIAMVIIILVMLGVATYIELTDAASFAE